MGHFLFLMMGEKAVCEHVGKARGGELSRFRHSRRSEVLWCGVLFSVVFWYVVFWHEVF